MIRTVHIKDLPGYVRSMPKQRFAAGVKAIRLTMRTCGRRFVSEEIKATSPHPPFDRGSYDRSWQTVNMDGGARFFSTSVYASVIDNGRRPGKWPPFQAILGWVHRKQLAEKWGWITAKVRKSRKASAKLDVQAAEKGIAFIVMAAIKRRGLPPKRVFARAAKRLIVACKQAWRSSVANAAEKAS